MENCFRPHEGDPSSLHRTSTTSRTVGQGFRPHEGDPSSLHAAWLSVPLDSVMVSVPTKGTHLLYCGLMLYVRQFRVSVPTKGTHLLYDKWYSKHYEKGEFPSPRRGPIFSTLSRLPVEMNRNPVSVPTKGTHLLYECRATSEEMKKFKFPSPRRGPIFSTEKDK